MMRIKPEVSTGRVNPETGLPEEETTEVETDVLLGNGQGMIIGGLIKETDSITASKFSGLADLKYVGGLFQRRQTTKARSEIIVALVPHVLPYSPELHARNEHEMMRVNDPLVQGPLCRYPRPYEPRLQDAYDNPKCRLRDDPCQCQAPTFSANAECRPPSVYVPPVSSGSEAVIDPNYPRPGSSQFPSYNVPPPVNVPGPTPALSPPSSVQPMELLPSPSASAAAVQGRALRR